MFKALKRWWSYMGAKLNGSLEERADPKVQLEQAINEAKERHNQLKQQATSVIANQKQTELKLNRTMAEYEKLSGNARQAVLMAEEASKTGDTAKATEYTSAAESFANRLIAVETEIEDLKELHLQSTAASDQAKQAVAQNSRQLQDRINERSKLLSQLDQAKMQEQMNSAMSTLSESVGEDVPTLEEVRDKIERRYAKAQGASDLQGASVEGKMLEVEQAALNTQAQARLAEIKSQLGIDSAAATSATATSEVADAPAGDTPGETSTA